MAEPLSIAASAFAVVRVADVVLRTGLQVYSSLESIKDAPKEIAELKDCVGTIKLLAEEAKDYLQELEKVPAGVAGSSNIISPSSGGPVQRAKIFLSILKGLDRELSALDKLMKRNKLFTKPWGRVKWVLDERNIARSMQRLDSHRANLLGALELIGRRNDISLPPLINDNFQKAINQIKTAISTESQTQKLSMQKITDAVSHSNNQILDTKTNVLANLKQEHEVSRLQTITSSKEVIEAISSELASKLSLVNLQAKHSGRQINLFGQSRDILTPLLLLKPAMRWALTHMLSHHRDLVSEECISWLTSEFHKLIASAHQEAAAGFDGSTATAFDTWKYDRNSYPPQASVTSTFGASTPCKRSDGKKRKSTAADDTVPQKRRKRETQHFSFESKIGVLEISFDSLNPTDSLKQCSDAWQVRFSFSPKPSVCRMWLIGRFKRAVGLESRAPIYPQLIALIVRPSEEVHDYQMDVYSSWSIPEIDAAIENGLISPYEVSELGETYCFYFAAIFHRLDLFHYFRNRGLHANSIDNGRGALSGYWFLTQSSSNQGGWDESLEESTFGYISGIQNLEANLSHRELSIGSCYFALPTESGIKRYRRWMQLLKDNEFDFNEKDARGDTPLLRYAGPNGPCHIVAIQLLLESGSSIHTSDLINCNALQVAMERNFMQRDFSETLEWKLFTLIKAGCDVNHCDGYGRTPSDVALENNHWEEWCMALESNGLDLQCVLQHDEKSKFEFGENSYDVYSTPSDGGQETKMEDSCEEACCEGVSDEKESCEDELITRTRKMEESLENWLARKAEAVHCFEQINEVVTATNQSTNGQFKKLSKFLMDGLIRLETPYDREHLPVCAEITHLEASQPVQFYKICCMAESFFPSPSDEAYLREGIIQRMLDSWGSADRLQVALKKLKLIYLAEKAIRLPIPIPDDSYD